jgi:hypothetical protein
VDGIAAWKADWAWSLPMIVMTVVFHVAGLGLLSEMAGRLGGGGRSRSVLVFLVRLGIVALLAVVLHGLESFAWAGAYLWLGALPSLRQATLVSLGAMTTYGSSGIELAREWQLMGALEALNGMLLFGLTTAFLFAIVQKLWPRRLADGGI